MLTRGLGRSYGDASLPPPGRGPTASSIRADRVLAFDPDSGLLRAEAGLSLGRLADLFLPRGWFVPVTPGTCQVTVGGMVAADVHGKNHHVAGTIGRHVRALRLRLASGDIRDVTDESDPSLFRATLGGMGLTGHILDATFALERVASRCIVEETRACPDLESLIEALREAADRWPFTVAWSDFLAAGGSFGRGVLHCGRWADAYEAGAGTGFTLPRIAVPRRVPEALLTNASVGAFHALRFEAARRRGHRAGKLRSAESFFYPLDALADWNRLYGRRGLTQYQCVLPTDPTMRSYRRLALAARSGGPGPFLAVVKDCGDEGRGLLSFPMPGLSFALDFPIHEGTGDLVAKLNDVVIEAGGRIYLAKDAFTTASQFAALEPRLGAFLDLRDNLDPDHAIDSALARRLFGARHRDRSSGSLK